MKNNRLDPEEIFWLQLRSKQNFEIYFDPILRVSLFSNTRYIHNTLAFRYQAAPFKLWHVGNFSPEASPSQNSPLGDSSKCLACFGRAYGVEFYKTVHNVSILIKYLSSLYKSGHKISSQQLILFKPVIYAVIQ